MSTSTHIVQGPPFGVVGISSTGGSCDAAPQFLFAVPMEITQSWTASARTLLDSVAGKCFEGAIIALNVDGDPSDFIVKAMGNPGGYLLGSAYSDPLCSLSTLGSISAFAAAENVCTPVIQPSSTLLNSFQLQSPLPADILSLNWKINGNGTVEIGYFSDVACQDIVPSAAVAAYLPETCVPTTVGLSDTHLQNDGSGDGFAFVRTSVTTSGSGGVAGGVSSSSLPSVSVEPMLTTTSVPPVVASSSASGSSIVSAYSSASGNAVSIQGSSTAVVVSAIGMSTAIGTSTGKPASYVKPVATGSATRVSVSQSATTTASASVDVKGTSKLWLLGLFLSSFLFL